MKCSFSCFVYFAATAFAFAQVNSAVEKPFNEKDHRQFDFWIGEWDVILRIQQDDYSWKDAVKSTARIYRILDGKAILELWNEDKFGEGIKGYSLRYFNTQKEKWELWLNWPGKNRSGSSSLEGSFRHGRGDFYSESMIDDSTSLISRYSFNDITANSLRWEDAYSRDGGKTWSNSWIMEFARTRDLAPALNHNQLSLTYDKGERCDLPEFKELEKLEGKWKGTLTISDNQATEELTWEVYKVLDGCAVISFMEYAMDGSIKRRFSLKTFNTYASQFEETVLDNDPDTQVEIFYGTTDDGLLTTQLFDQVSRKSLDKKNQWKFGEEKIEWTLLSDKEGIWTKSVHAVFHKL